MYKILIKPRYYLAVLALFIFSLALAMPVSAGSVTFTGTIDDTDAEIELCVDYDRVEIYTFSVDVTGSYDFTFGEVTFENPIDADSELGVFVSTSEFARDIFYGGFYQNDVAENFSRELIADQQYYIFFSDCSNIYRSEYSAINYSFTIEGSGNINTTTTDLDGDGVGDDVDNCPQVINTDQTDTDGDGFGDACDSTPNGDDDSDGIDNLVDNCPIVINLGQRDTDNDGTGDACDPTPNADGGYANFTGLLDDTDAPDPDDCRQNAHMELYDFSVSQSGNYIFGFNSVYIEPGESRFPPRITLFARVSSETPIDENVIGYAGVSANKEYSYDYSVTLPDDFTIYLEADHIYFLAFGDCGDAGNYYISASYDFMIAGPGEIIGSMDSDGDGIITAYDNCLRVANADQLDTDADGLGDVCDSTPNGDDDSDGVDNLTDNCPAVANTDQLDTDADGLGDVCDSTPNGDDDSDGVDNLTDNCPAVVNSDQTDTDLDGIGDVCDSTPNGDDDSDGVDNLTDNCPAVANSNQTDTDLDGIGDVCDSTPNGDDDSDDVDNLTDNCPAVANTGQADNDLDGLGNVCDSTPNGDDDSDGVDNLADNCPAVANSDQTDTDLDGIGDACDLPSYVQQEWIDASYTVDACYLSGGNGSPIQWRVTNYNSASLDTTIQVRVLFDWELRDATGTVIQSADRQTNPGIVTLNTPDGYVLQIDSYLDINNGQYFYPVGTAIAEANSSFQCSN